MCLVCHKEQIEAVHARGVLRCSDCHLGNSLDSDKGLAHKGMVKNPGELYIAQKTCGRTGCHTKEAGWVKNTLMATNRGIISTLLYYWKEAEDQYSQVGVDTLKRGNMTDSPAIDYFSKLCGTCHLWLEKGKHPDFLAEKGGGCTACHIVKESEKGHPRIVRAIPIKNCVRCHNRSGRIGLTYQGIFETEGYGTPFENGDFSENELEDGRFFRKIDPDVHFVNGLLCVDCHTQKETMGDGKRRAHMEEQLEITCEDCHSPKALMTGKKKGLRIITIDNRPFLKRKADNKPILLSMTDSRCEEKTHKRLSCQACHSRWVPQCYGCHIVNDKRKGQMNWIKGKKTPSSWAEFRSIVRYESPPLGVLRQEDGKEKVVIIVPG